MNERGSTTLLMLMLVSALSLFCIFTLEFAKRQYIANQSRARAYLCMKYQLNSTYNYSKIMRIMNISIASAFKLSFIPKVKIVHQGLVQLQQVYHISFVQKISMQGPCHFTQRLSFIYNQPYQHIGIVLLKRLPDGQAMPKKEATWKYSLSNFTADDQAKISFVLSAEVSFHKQRLKIVSTQEEAIAAWSRSQLFSFLASPPAWLPSQLKSISKYITAKKN